MKNVLLDKGIILPSGEISKDKVNLVTGAITQPFAEMVWVTTIFFARPPMIKKSRINAIGPMNVNS